MKEDLEVRLRRYQTNLSDAGMGVIAFGTWSVISTLITLFQSQNNGDLANLNTLELIVYWGLMAVVLALELFIRVVIGISARKEGKGKKKGCFYIVLAVVILILSALTTIYSNFYVLSIIHTVAVILFEVGSDAVLLDVIICSILVKSLKKQIAQRKE